MKVKFEVHQLVTNLFHLLVDLQNMSEKLNFKMPKKKVQINAFYMYMIEQKALLERRGRVFPGGLKDVAGVVRSDWNRLSPAEKERYDTAARIEKEKVNSTHRGKLTSDGRLISEVVAKESDEKNKHKNMVKSIQNWIQELSLEDVVNETFYIISFNITVEVLSNSKSEDDNWCIPNEIGMVEYSIKSGIKRWYHSFIHPGKLPIGYAFYAQEHSDNNHQIPIHGHEKANDNYPAIWIRMKNFINQDEEKTRYPPVFTNGYQIEQTRKCIDWLYRRGCDSRRNMFRVYDCSYLLLELRMKVDHPLASLTEANELLSGSTFQFASNSSCEWHEEIDCPKCPLGSSKLNAYYLSDALCHFYNVEITPSHLPESVENSHSIAIGSALQTHPAMLPHSSLRLSENSPKSLKFIAPEGDDAESYEEQSQDFDQFSDNLSQPSGAYGASGFSQNNTTDYSQSQRFSEMQKLTTTFSQATLDYSGSTQDEQEGEVNWIPVGRGSSRKKEKEVSSPRHPNQTGIGRGLLNRPA